MCFNYIVEYIKKTNIKISHKDSDPSLCLKGAVRSFGSISPPHSLSLGHWIRLLVEPCSPCQAKGR